MKHCLLVDDSKMVRIAARQIIRDWGFDITEASNGIEALACCKIRMPDVILLDWTMPEMNGIEFLRRLREMPGGEYPRVLFCTSMTDIDYIQQAIISGADEYIMKPFDAAVLQSKFSSAGLI